MYNIASYINTAVGWKFIMTGENKYSRGSEYIANISVILLRWLLNLVLYSILPSHQ